MNIENMISDSVKKKINELYESEKKLKIELENRNKIECEKYLNGTT